MSYYVTSPFKPTPASLQGGKPEYLWGSFDDRSAPTSGPVLQTSTNGTTTATLTFQIVAGNIPSIGDLITVIGTANGSGNFNVTNVQVLSVTTTNSGVCTVTYTIPTTATPTSPTADVGAVLIPRIELSENLHNGASVPVAVPAQNPVPNQGRIITVVVSFPTVPQNAQIFLQEAIKDQDSEYNTIATVAVIANSVISPTSGNVFSTAVEVNGRFYRLLATGVTGVGGSIIGKIYG